MKMNSILGFGGIGLVAGGAFDVCRSYKERGDAASKRFSVGISKMAIGGAILTAAVGLEVLKSYFNAPVVEEPVDVSILQRRYDEPQSYPITLSVENNTPCENPVTIPEPQPEACNMETLSQALKQKGENSPIGDIFKDVKEWGEMNCEHYLPWKSSFSTGDSVPDNIRCSDLYEIQSRDLAKRTTLWGMTPKKEPFVVCGSDNGEGSEMVHTFFEQYKALISCSKMINRWNRDESCDPVTWDAQLTYRLVKNGIIAW